MYGRLDVVSQVTVGGFYRRKSTVRWIKSVKKIHPGHIVAAADAFLEGDDGVQGGFQLLAFVRGELGEDDSVDGDLRGWGEVIPNFESGEE